jgi:hypothetical protein
VNLFQLETLRILNNHHLIGTSRLLEIGRKGRNAWFLGRTYSELDGKVRENANGGISITFIIILFAIHVYGMGKYDLIKLKLWFRLF